MLYFNNKQNNSVNKYYYDQPAQSWFEAVPIGNGRIGGMIWGGIEKEIINLNEATLWSGEPVDKQNHKGILYLPEIRKLIQEDKTREAEKLIDSTMLGPWNESYQPLGDLLICFEHKGKISDYKREVNLSKGIVTIRYRAGKTSYSREIFVSYPDQVMVIHLSSKNGTINFKTTLASNLKHETCTSDNSVILTGQAPSHVYPSYLGPDLNSIYSAGKGMRFQSILKVLIKDGICTQDRKDIKVQNASEVMLILAAQTSYNGYDKDPFKDGKDYKSICKNDIDKAIQHSYRKLYKNHIADYSALFDRLNIDLGKDSCSLLPMDERVKNYRPGSDPELTSLYFQFGRYLLISSSRPGSQPANLQGIWNKDLRPAWSSNWTLNCNAEINYWPVELANLSECHLPLIQMAKELSADGAKTSKNLYGARGWIAHHNTDIWRTTSPVGGSGVWAIYQVGSAWLCHHLWEHYAFTGDRAYLADVYLTMHDAALFYLDVLQTDPKTGWLVTNPSESFENTYIKPDGTVGWACMGATQDMQIIRDLFCNCINASKELGRDDTFALKLSEALKRLPPLQINPETGRLQEWLEPWEPSNPNSNGGQVAHGWGLVPGNQISLRGTPELAGAIRKVLEYQKPWEHSYATWVGSWAANYWARLEDGNMLQKMLDGHFSTAIFPSLLSKVTPSLFQIDGNLGITAAIGEMLIQSHNGEINLLPAISPSFQTGKVSGLCARGGFEVYLKWGNMQLKEVKVYSKLGGKCVLRYREKVIEFDTEKGKTYKFKREDFQPKNHS
jgi:alpha-L-fucosidase 2